MPFSVRVQVSSTFNCEMLIPIPMLMLMPMPMPISNSEQVLNSANLGCADVFSY